MRRNPFLTGCALVTTLVAAPANSLKEDALIPEAARIAELQVVDCLLPGQVRQLGRRTFMTPRRPTRTTAADCEVRGGEYVAFDRADYKTALKVWMPAAESGDAEAQVNVGEIFEKGLGTDPNYEAALIWYEKAAEQGNTRAQFNLGTLYERGLGVAPSKVQALNWYRKAWGMAEDDVMFTSAAAREQDALRASLSNALQEKQAQIDVLTQQVGQLERSLGDMQAQADAESAAAQAADLQVKTLKRLIADLESQQIETQAELDAIPKTRAPTAAKSPDPEVRNVANADGRVYKDMDLGRYYALLIGNADYGVLEDLDTPLNDITRARRILEDQYGFTVITIENSNNIELMEAINDLYDVLGENDNLLLFYAGHGNRLQTGSNEIGYWLPSNAEQPPRNTYWVANEFVSGHLSRLKAKRILVVADSCYAGLLSGEPSFLLLGDSAPAYDDPEFLRFKLGKRARLLLASGGDKPVLDGGGSGHSVFARAFLEELENNDGILAAPELYLKVKDRVSDAAEQYDFDQTPDLKTIKAAGHEIGDFFFVPVAMR